MRYLIDRGASEGKLDAIHFNSGTWNKIAPSLRGSIQEVSNVQGRDFFGNFLWTESQSMQQVSSMDDKALG